MPNVSAELDKQLRKLEALILQAQVDSWRNYSSTLMMGLKALLDCINAPTWMKSLDGRVLYINPAFGERFKIRDPAGYLGKTESDTWGKRIGNEWRANDAKVLRSGKETYFSETSPHGGVIHVRKWPVRVDGHLVGIAGEVVSGSDFIE